MFEDKRWGWIKEVYIFGKLSCQFVCVCFLILFCSGVMGIFLDSVKVHVCVFGQHTLSFLWGQGIVTSVGDYCRLCRLAHWVGDNVELRPLCRG